MSIRMPAVLRPYSSLTASDSWAKSNAARASAELTSPYADL